MAWLTVWLRLLAASIVALGIGAVDPALAQTYPTRPITLIVPYAPGGPMDTVARLVASIVTAKLGQNVVVDNRGGAGGTLGTRLVMSAAPDGYTLLWGSSGTLAVAAALYKNVNYDPSSLEPVALVATLPHVLVVNPALPVKTVKDLVDYAKANPGKVQYGGSLGTPPHLMGALFQKDAGLDMTFIPYKGAAPSIIDLLADRTQFTFDALTVLYPLVEQGKLKALAVVDDKRWPALPDVPTMPESGFPDMTMIAFSGVLAPEGTPNDIVAKLNGAINEGLAVPEAKAKLAQLSALAQPGSPADFARYIAKVGPAWQGLVKISGATVE
jgi:tripartite-type tricarboxylate transporter receptor subunit TctC